MTTISFDRVSKTYEKATAPALDTLSLDIDDGEFLVLVGPSGCGKSTALRLLAGLEEIGSGELRLGGKRVNEQSPQQRNIAMVFQNYALYPHKTVAENIEFPLRMAGVGRAERTERARRIAARFQLEPYLTRLPRQLSGGQKQRVAMARALIRDPVAFLLDEPLSNLDAQLRVQMRAEIAQLQRDTGTTAVYVTHDQVEAMTMGHRVAVLRDGRLQQVAPPQELYARPTNIFVASFIGSPAMALFRATVLADGAPRLRLGGQELALPATTIARLPALSAGGPFVLGLRPEAFRLAATAPDLPRLRLAPALVEGFGHEQLVYVDLPVPAVGADGTDSAATCRAVARLPAQPMLTAGQELELAVDTGSLHAFDASGRSLWVD